MCSCAEFRAYLCLGINASFVWNQLSVRSLESVLHLQSSFAEITMEMKLSLKLHICERHTIGSKAHMASVQRYMVFTIVNVRAGLA